MSKTELLAQNLNLNHLVEAGFQEVNRFFCFSIWRCCTKNKQKKMLSSRWGHKRLQCYDWWKKGFWSTNKNNKIIYENIRKIDTGQGDDYATGCLLDYTYFRDYYKMLATDLIKQQALDADLRAIQQINFTANLDFIGNARIFFIFKKAKETVLDFSLGTIKIL